MTTNPLVLERDGVKCNTYSLTQFGKALFEIGTEELHIHSWGANTRSLVSHALDLAGIDRMRVVVKLPCTDDGIVVRRIARNWVTH